MPSTMEINSAIYAESSVKNQPLNINKFCLSIDKYAGGDSIFKYELPTFKDDNKCLKTYRCVSTPIFDNSFLKTERRCKIIDKINNSLTKENEEIMIDTTTTNNEYKSRHLKTSISQLNTNIIKKTDNLRASRQISYEDWRRSKEKEIWNKRKTKSNIEIRKKEEENLDQNQAKKEQEKENFLSWIKKKEIEKYAMQKKVSENELKLQRTFNDLNELSDAMKKIAIMQWEMKKNLEKKAEYKKLKMQLEKIEQLKQTRLEHSLEAFKKWSEKSKFVAKPITQGLMPHHAAKPSFINPEPWKNITEDINLKMKS